MKRTFIAMAFLGMIMTGCAHHYQRVENGDVKLFLCAPKAREVLFASSLDGYRPHPAQRIGESAWMIRVPADKEFSYFYLVDGHVLVPECTYRERDDFGSANCIFLPGM